MFFGENVVAQVWSFTNKFQDIPYLLLKKNYARSNNYYLTCNCPAYTRRRITACKHINEFKLSVSEGRILNDDRFSLSDLGIKLINEM